MKHVIIYMTAVMLAVAPALIQGMPVPSESVKTDKKIEIHKGGYGTAETVITALLVLSLATLFDDNDDNDIYGAIGAGILLGIGIVYMSFAVGQSVAENQRAENN